MKCTKICGVEWEETRDQQPKYIWQDGEQVSFTVNLPAIFHAQTTNKQPKKKNDEINNWNNFLINIHPKRKRTEKSKFFFYCVCMKCLDLI